MDQQLIDDLKRSEDYLAQKVNTNPNYHDLIKIITVGREKLQTPYKPLIKLVSPSVDLVEKFRVKIEANEILRSLYYFQVVSPIQQVFEIVKNCQIICLIYNSQHNIKPHHQELIDLAKQQDIYILVVVISSNIDHPDNILAQWQAAQQYPIDQQSVFTINFSSLNNGENLDVYYKVLIDLSQKIKISPQEHIINNITNEIENFFKQETNKIKQTIKQLKENSTPELLSASQADVRQVFNNLRQEIQQLLRNIKQDIQQSKGEYLNPFLPYSWMFLMQKNLELSQVKIVAEKQELYLDLVIHNGKNTEYFHSYILNFYQTQVLASLESQWEKINYQYGDGGLQTLIHKINSELENLRSLYLDPINLPKFNLHTQPKSQLDLNQIINSNCLKEHTRITFDYNYTQSNWFRLIISILIGLIIYLVTDKYIGFFILIFQLINLLTGQNIKQLKLRQHQKELKRTVDNKYQVLLRLIVEQLSQTLINDLESHIQLYQQQIDTLANQLQGQSEDNKTKINQYKSNINNLLQDQAQILNWLNK
ncbi:FHA domain containing protein [Chondrocystis sp. NIES-4102]|nr:FHA domain containing protein [Chondrocystis sp. NIES-4102]